MRAFTIFAGLAALASAQHIGLKIPQIEMAVKETLEEFTEYVHYKTPKNAPSKPHHIPRPVPNAASCDFWMDDIPHNGVAAFNSNSSYQVYRNVKNFGAVGDGQTDDTAAIQRAISAGNRCVPGSCESSTTSPAVVYFPSGTYLISTSIVDYYYTQIIGNPNCPPILLGAPNFSSHYIGLIDADPYTSQNQAYGSTNVFWRQIRHMTFDTSQIAASSSIAAVHWPTAQATSITDCTFNLGTASGTQHVGLFIENGSAGVLTDLIINGGLTGLQVGGQQFTMRNLTFNGCTNAVNMGFDWAFTWQQINVNNAKNGLVINNIGGTGNNVTEVGAITVLDSSFTNVGTAVVAARNANTNPKAANQVILENIALNNVPVVVSNSGTTALAGTSGTGNVAAWGQGISYTPSGPNNFASNLPVGGNPGGRPSSLLSNGKYLSIPKPSFAGYTTSTVITARSKGATGNGHTDDTTALQNAINAAVQSNSLLFVDAGTYLVTKTLTFPPGLKITGETYPVIMSSGSFFNNMNSPQPVIQIGTAGQTGSIQWTDMIVSTQGQQQGAILIQYNLASMASQPSGIWDVHTRIGGFAGSNLQVSQCPTTPGTTVTSSNLNQNCIAAYMSMWLTPKSAGLYMENMWLWTADHDVDDPNSTQITIYTGRGLLVQSPGPNWLIGTAVEHHSKYQYQFYGAKNVYAGFIQTETPYYQPNPGATIPFAPVSSIADPTFPTSGNTGPASTNDAWGLRVLNSSQILVYGAGLYSFFNNYSTNCLGAQNQNQCQQNIAQLAGSNNDITIYTLATVGTVNAINNGGTQLGSVANDNDGFTDLMAWFTTNTS